MTEPNQPVAPTWDAVVLAGGRARRLGGVDKPAALVGGRTLLDRVLTAAVAAATVVVVGPTRAAAVERPVRWVREDPPGGGPLAGLSAGLACVRAPFVAVLAADLPFITAADLGRLLAAARGTSGFASVESCDVRANGGQMRGVQDSDVADCAVLVDPSGYWQPLAAVWRTPALRAAMPAVSVGTPMKTLFAGRRVRGLPGSSRTCLDCDSPTDLAAARALAGTTLGHGEGTAGQA
jgi:molybdopterin-guanine dinucleotide biosynthesis protein A